MKPGWDGRYREGVKGRCFWCGKKREDHKAESCPGWKAIREPDYQEARRRQREQNMLSRLVATGWPD